MRKKQPLTQEEEQIRLRGLRILARMIVRAHLNAQGIEGDRLGDGCTDDVRAKHVPGMEGEHVG